MRPYEFLCWIEERRDKDDEVVEAAKILVQPTLVMARGEKEVAMVAAREIPSEYVDRLERVHIEVRPFFG